MGVRFRKSIKVAPGVRLNVSKSGVSTTVGVRGASVNVGKQGVYGNAGIPGTGLSVREKLKKPKPNPKPSPKSAKGSKAPERLQKASMSVADTAASAQSDQAALCLRFWEGYFTRGLRRSRRSYAAATVAWVVVLFLAIVSIALGPEPDSTASALMFMFALLVYVWAQLWISIQRARDAGVPSFIGGLVLFFMGPVGWAVGFVVPSKKVLVHDEG
ncbi:DUF4236 domain-containing protein [Celeribacter halophilus]|uniref:DUF4236 domain-containing protein n=1 Tax=Celeribacter halophilus TaxID=576117 RepID=UPI0026E37052|nr:DUF4236 domain-containing protein [Celeribacter halophilus]MDO6722628.1 DUF4236 domain-containing protein [Celeribacter halophilus]